MEYAKLYKSIQDRYLNKIEIGFRLPGELNLSEVWQEIQEERKARGEVLALKDEKGIPFWYVNTKPLQSKLHQIDSRGKDSLYRHIKPDIENELILDSIIEEAWASNIIEGAFTTHKRAQELVRRNLTPKDKNELMTKNNHLAMTYILEHRESEFNIDLILKIHQIITQGTLDDPEYAGKFRDDEVFIWDKTNTVIFKPMAAEKIEPCLNNLVTWVNTHSDEDFIHPVVKASIIHFYLVYVHPGGHGDPGPARSPTPSWREPQRGQGGLRPPPPGPLFLPQPPALLAGRGYSPIFTGTWESMPTGSVFCRSSSTSPRGAGRKRRSWSSSGPWSTATPSTSSKPPATPWRWTPRRTWPGPRPISPQGLKKRRKMPFTAKLLMLPPWLLYHPD